MTPVQLPEVPEPFIELITHAVYDAWAAQLRAYATEAVMAERIALQAIGDDWRVNDDSYLNAVESARSWIGASRPEDTEPEDQWMWDKLTALAALLTPSETNNGR